MPKNEIDKDYIARLRIKLTTLSRLFTANLACNPVFPNLDTIRELARVFWKYSICANKRVYLEVISRK
jgi:hypothetical protein